MCSSQIEEWAKYENSWQKTERGCEGGDRDDRSYPGEEETGEGEKISPK